MANDSGWDVRDHDFSDYDRDDNGECGDCCECECADDDRCDDCASCCAPDGSYHKKCKSNVGWNTQTGGVTMFNRTIEKMYERTADAALVNKFFGGTIPQNDIEVIVLKPHAKEILEKAKELQAKEDERNNVVTAKIVA